MMDSFDLRGVAERLAESLAPAALARAAEFTCIVPSDLSGVLGDSRALEAALAAAVEAALSVVCGGELVLTVRREGEGATQGPAPLRFRIQGGTGLSTPEAREAPGQRGASAAAVDRARRLVAAVGGDLRVQGLAHHGVDLRFSASFPPDPHWRPPDLPPDCLDDLRVLAVDESEPRRRALRELLAACGCRAGAAGGALQAMAILRTARAAAQPVRLVLVAADLLEVPAAAFSHAVRSDPHLCTTRLVLISPPGRRCDPVALAADGFAGELVRPVTRASLATLTPPDQEARAPGQVADLGRRGGDTPRVRRGRVLVAEDNETNSRVILAILENLGYRADSVASGVEALRALAADSYDLVLMDIAMPAMDGLEATRRIRRGEAGEAARGLPILALTCHASAESRACCHEAGMNDFITKPIDADRLRVGLDCWIGVRPGQPEASAGSAGAVPDQAPGRAQDQAREPARDLDGRVFDLDGLLRRLDGDMDAVRTLLAIFTRNLAVRLAVLDSAFTLGDVEQVRRAAHALKGMARNVEAVSLAELAARIEQLARERDLAAAQLHRAAIVACGAQTEARIARSLGAERAGFGTC